MEAVNPFIVGTPIVDEQNFYGRKALLRHILKEFSNPAKNSFLLYGPRLIGKTSLLKQLEFLLSDEGYTQIYIDLSGKSKLSLNELLYEISCVVAEACAFEPPRLENFDRHGRYFTEFFIPAIEKTDRFGPVALLFDVFDVPAQAGGKQNAAEFLPILARHFKALRQTKIVCSVGSHSRYMALAQHFDCVLPVSRFSKAELNAMMQTGSGQTVEWSEAALERLWNFRKGHP